MTKLSRVQLSQDIVNNVYTNTKKLIKGNTVRDRLKNIVDSVLIIDEDADTAGGYMKIGAGGFVDVSFIKAASPTGTKFLCDDGTWQTPAGTGGGGGGTGDAIPLAGTVALSPVTGNIEFSSDTKLFYNDGTWNTYVLFDTVDGALTLGYDNGVSSEIVISDLIQFIPSSGEARVVEANLTVPQGRYETGMAGVHNGQVRWYTSANANRVDVYSNPLTANRAIYWPDAGGTVALTSDLGAYLPLAGGTLTGALVLAANPVVALGAATKGYVDSAITALNISAYLPLAGGTMVGALVLAADPVTGMGAATKNYVDNAIAGLKFKTDVRAASTGNVTVSSPGTSSFDGVTLSNGDRLLLRAQTDAKENGVYIFNGSASALTRATDADTGTELANKTVPVTEGTTYADTWFTCTNDSITIGVTNITFTQTAGVGTYTNGAGITLTGNVFSIGTGAISDSMLASIFLKPANNLSDVSSAATSRVNLGIDKRTAVGDANYTILVTDMEVVTSVPFTAARTFTLPTGVAAGREIIVADELQTVTSTNTLTIAAPSGKKLNGVTNGTEVIVSAGGWRRFISDGSDNWIYDAGVVRLAASQTLTNKRITKRVVSVASSATPTLNTDNCDFAVLNGLSTNATNMSTNLSGTPTDRQMFAYEILDNGTPKTISWGASFANGGIFTLPTTTVANTWLCCVFRWNANTSKWEIVGLA